jgi:hypothetical protein
MKKKSFLKFIPDGATDLKFLWTSDADWTLGKNFEGTLAGT